MSVKRKRLPKWLRKRNPYNKNIMETKKILIGLGLQSVCHSAKCPNMGECFANKTATFMIMGNTCTRKCSFCAVNNGSPSPLDRDEPYNLTQAVEELGLKHVVITSVTRDDLPDGGAIQFVRCINELRKLDSNIVIEILTPDFKMNKEAIRQIVAAEPDIFNHNIETIPRLYSEIRPEAVYRRSLEVLKYIKELDKKIYTKSGIMLGLGETVDEVIQVMKDLRSISCDILTIGQYLQPTKNHYPVVEYIEPVEFEEYQESGERLGFRYVSSGPLVRSSYQADNFSNRFM